MWGIKGSEKNAFGTTKARILGKKWHGDKRETKITFLKIFLTYWKKRYGKTIYILVLKYPSLFCFTYLQQLHICNKVYF